MPNVANAKSLPEFLSADKTAVPLPSAQALPVPPLSYGNVQMANAVVANNKLGATQFVPTAFGIEGTYSEPTLGQIWPRIG